MALRESLAAEIPFKGRLFDLNHLSESATRTSGAYRCPACGDELTFDSLAIRCRCFDECYEDPPRRQRVPDSR